MKNLYIPEIGDEIILGNNWSFVLYAEKRNDQLGSFFNHLYLSGLESGWLNFDDYVKEPEFNGSYWSKESIKYIEEYTQWRKNTNPFLKKSIDINLPKGTILVVDRIYIRKGNKDYSSITFMVKNLGEKVITTKSYGYGKNKKQKKNIFRFWVKLSDANEIIML